MVADLDGKKERTAPEEKPLEGHTALLGGFINSISFVIVDTYGE